MQFSQFYILFLVILLLFGIGGNILKRERINKWLIIFVLLIEFACTFIPNFYIKNIELNVAYSILPFMVSIFLLFSIRNSVLFARTIVGVLISSIIILIYQVFMPSYLYEYNFLQPNLLIAPFLAVLLFFVCKTNKSVALAVIWGSTLSCVISSGLLNNTGLSYVIFGGDLFISIILITISISCFVSFVYRKIKLIQKLKQRKKILQRN